MIKAENSGHCAVQIQNEDWTELTTVPPPQSRPLQLLAGAKLLLPLLHLQLDCYCSELKKQKELTSGTIIGVIAPFAFDYPNALVPL
jgi:hypothetical protein